VGMGSFLYQVEVYEKTAENEALLLAKMGYSLLCTPPSEADLLQSDPLPTPLLPALCGS